MWLPPYPPIAVSEQPLVEASQSNHRNSGTIKWQSGSSQHQKNKLYIAMKTRIFILDFGVLLLEELEHLRRFVKNALVYHN